MTKPKLGLVCTSGGHLAQMLKLKEVYDRYDHFFVTNEHPVSEEMLEGERVHWVPLIYLRSAKETLQNSMNAHSVLRLERPDVVLTTGSGTAVPFCIIATYLYGVHLISIESFARYHALSLTAKLLKPIADVTFVQWPELAGDGLEFAGSLYRVDALKCIPRRAKIFGTVGTSPVGFDGIVRALDGLENHEVVVQYGESSYRPRNATGVRYATQAEYDHYIEWADFVVTAGGGASVGAALERGRRVIIVRDPEYPYHGAYDIADAVENHRLGVAAESPEELEEAIARVGRLRGHSMPGGDLVGHVAELVEGWA